jgi:hypothetical protein
MRNSRHPFTRALYSLRDDGNVDVTDGDRSGVFRPDGRWVSGTLREADPQLCVWIANNPPAPPVADSHITDPKRDRV